MLCCAVLRAAASGRVYRALQCHCCACPNRMYCPNCMYSLQHTPEIEMHLGCSNNNGNKKRPNTKPLICSHCKANTNTDGWMDIHLMFTNKPANKPQTKHRRTASLIGSPCRVYLPAVQLSPGVQGLHLPAVQTYRNVAAWKSDNKQIATNRTATHNSHPCLHCQARNGIHTIMTRSTPIRVPIIRGRCCHDPVASKPAAHHKVASPKQHGRATD
jgi:hypothetical protein